MQGPVTVSKSVRALTSRDEGSVSIPGGRGVKIFTQDGDRWVTIERSKICLISQRSLKSNEKDVSVWDPCVLIDLSAISTSGWKNLAFIERSLRDHWEIVERSLSIHREIASLGDHWEIVLDLVNHERPWKLLGDHWQIIDILAITKHSFNDHSEI